MRGITRNHGIENAPGAYGLLAGLVHLLLVAIALTAGGCATLSPLDAWIHEVDVEGARAVEISAVCLTPDGQLIGWSGSGSIVDGTRVLTAGHIAETDGAMCTFTAEDKAGKTYLLYPRVVLSSETVDLAVMELLSPVARFHAPAVRFAGNPRVGEEVCTSTGSPRREHKCGEVQPYMDYPGNMVMTMVVDHGNSGAGVYDSSGRLVGVVTHLIPCTNGQYCLGRASTLMPYMKELGLE